MESKDNNNNNVKSPTPGPVMVYEPSPELKGADKVMAIELFNRCNELEKELRNANKKKRSMFDKQLTTLRTQLRDSYEKFIFVDYENSVKFDMENALWKSVFYKYIEEFRSRFRKAAAAKDQEIGKLSATFKALLSSAMRFYHAFLQKLQSHFGLSLDASVSINNESERSKLPNWRCYLSYHRSLVYLGDLARYHKDIPITPDYNAATQQKDWVGANYFYRQALTLIPDNGAPHNQLAVLSTYTHNECNSVYRYYRSLLSKQPFPTLRENLVVLFERNRLRISEMTYFDNTRANNKNYKRYISSAPKGELVRTCLLGFIRLHGVLFTRTSLETFNSIKAVVLRDFETLVRNNYLTSPFVLRMLVINIHAIVNVQQGTDSSDSSQRALVQKIAIKFAVEFFGRLVRSVRVFHPRHNNTASQEEDEINAGDDHSINLKGSESSNLLGTIAIFLQWMLSVRNTIEIIRPDATQEKRAWNIMWKAVAKLTNRILVLEQKLEGDTRCIVEYIDRKGKYPLPEEAELRGFIPLDDDLLNLGLLFQSDQTRASYKSILDELQLYRIRANKIYHLALHFALQIELPKVMFYSYEEKKFSIRQFQPKYKPTPRQSVEAEDTTESEKSSEGGDEILLSEFDDNLNNNESDSEDSESEESDSPKLGLGSGNYYNSAGFGPLFSKKGDEDSTSSLFSSINRAFDPFYNAQPTLTEDNENEDVGTIEELSNPFPYDLELNETKPEKNEEFKNNLAGSAWPPTPVKSPISPNASGNLSGLFTSFKGFSSPNDQVVKGNTNNGESNYHPGFSWAPFFEPKSPNTTFGENNNLNNLFETNAFSSHNQDNYHLFTPFASEEMKYPNNRNPFVS